MPSDGKFCWYELMANDPAAAMAFYADVLGWGAEDARIPGVDYRLFTLGGARQGGLMKIERNGPPPGWTGYLSVEDCDAAVEAARAAGAAVHVGPRDIPGTGRFAILADPQGTPFAVIKTVPQAEGGASPPQAAWHQLHAKDGEAAWSFYAALFGWTGRRIVDMGPGGAYRVFGEAGGAEAGFGGMMTDSRAARPYWRFFFPVDGTSAAIERVRAAGGTVRHGPDEVPGGAWVAMCADPEGALFGIFSAER